MYQKSIEIDAGSLLTGLAAGIRDNNNDVDHYFDHIEEFELLNPMGIHHIISNTVHDRCIDMLSNDAVKTMISGCPVIQFANWAKTDNASRFWETLYADIIKPLNKHDFDFIFHLGDITNKLFFEIDEVLDIIGDYVSYGRVTMVLDENEAGKLWSRLYGRSADDMNPSFRQHSARDKYRFLFDAMNIDILLILYSNRAMLLSRDWQFDFGGRSLTSAHFPMYDEDSFNTGYQLGLLLHFDITHCLALGLAVSGMYLENGYLAGSKELLGFIDEWLAEMPVIFS